MKRLKFLLLTVVCVAVLFCVATVTASADVVASGNCGENITYTLDSDGTLTISGTGHMPDYWTTLPWDSYLSAIKEVNIESGVTSVGSNAFANCTALTSVVISEGVKTIGDSSFSGCSSLLSVDIPSSLTYVCWNAFGGCSSLNAVYISDIDAWCNTEFNSEWSNPLYYAKNLYLNGTLVTELTIPYETTKINAYSFCGCTSLESVTIENKECQIAYNEKAIPTSATIYGYGGSSAEVYAKLYDRDFVNLDETEEIIDAGYFGDNIVWSIDGKGKLVITGYGNMPSSFNQVIPWEKHKTNIKEVDISEEITSISSKAFYDGTNIHSVLIPKNVTSIGTSAFSGCIMLQNIELPETLTYLGPFAFMNCKNLQRITIPGGIKTIESSTFEGCVKLVDVNILSGIETIGTSAFEECNSLQRVIIPETVTKIGLYSFEDCCNLKEVILPSSLKSIGDYAFGNCDSLQDISLPANLTELAGAVFSGCSSLQNINIPLGITTINDNMFYHCSSLQNITLHSNIIMIGKHAFNGCNFQNIELPKSLTSLGKYAFYECKNLKSIVLPEGIEIIDSSTFSNCENLETVIIPDSVKSIEMLAFYGCKKLDNIIIPENVTQIANTAFGFCEKLSTIILGGSISEIGENAFILCDSINAIGYMGDADSKNAITISSGNDYLLNAVWYYNYYKTEHQYSGDCDKNCNICEFPRMVTASHTYTNSCDDTCNICGYVTAITHTFTDDCDSVCNICSFEREITYDYTITTDEDITLSYSTTANVRFVVSDETIAYITGTGMSSVVIGSYVSKTVSATITPKKPGGVIVSVVDSYNNVLAKSLLLVVEGEHQFELSKIISVRDCVTPGKAVYVCKFCFFEKEEYEEAYGHSYSYGCDSMCNRCDFVRTDISHDNTKSVAEVKATCTTKGYTAGVYCNDCQKYISGHAEIAINADAHKWDNGTITTTATCKVSGVKTYTCQHNASHKKTENLGVNASNHVNTKNVAEVKATCTTKGYTAGVYCNDCQKYISGHTEIPKLVPEFTDSKDAKESGNNIVSNNGLTVAQLLSQAGKGAVIKTADGKSVENAALIGTGMVLTMADGSKKEIVVYGDVDGDGKISAADARQALRASVGLENFKEDSAKYKAAKRGSLDKLSAADARLILRASVGLEDPKSWMK
ncbi:MAG: leucine-rich repeat protein [Clostridia bacterium]|nr:leucine-rich repeat protein [Clostridia bacterium]